MVIHGIAFFGAGWWEWGIGTGEWRAGSGLPVKALSFCCLTESSDWQGR